MAECNVSIDKNKLPGVKEVCRDFAVLEDHCLAYNLQEQEIESHLASNVNKSRLVQKDLQVAKKLQEEEDKRAKVQSQKQFVELLFSNPSSYALEHMPTYGDLSERQDNEIAQEIQEELVRQAEQQRQQEEKDAAIARKLQEKEMKEERKRQKQLEANFDEEYFEDHGAAARRPLDLDKPTRHKSTSPGRYDAHAPVSSHRDYSPDYNSVEPKRSRYPRQDPAAPHSRSRYPEHYLVGEGGRSKHADPYPEHLLPSRGKHRDRYPDYEPTETGRARGPWGEEPETVVRRKERPARPPPPQSPVERDKAWERERDRDRQRDRVRGRGVESERQMVKDQRKDREQEYRRRERRDGERSRDRVQSGDRYRETERQRQKEKERGRQRARARSMDRGLEEEPWPSRDRPREGRASLEEDWDDGERERRARGRQRVHSGAEEVFEELRSNEGRGDSRQWEGPSRKRSDTHPDEETGRIVHKGSGAVVAETEFKLSEATKGLTNLDLRELELKDMEVARKLQEEEIKASKLHVRAAQVAQDEEIARLMMEQEKREYKKNREREHEKEREKEKERERERLAMERMAMERRRPEGDYRPNSEEVVRPRTRDEYDYQRQRNHNKPARPPQPRAHDYENVNSGYGYSDHPVPPRAPARPEAAYKGAYYKR